MSLPSPAIVTQAGVRRLPRLALWALCLAYILPGFLGRVPWKSADMTAFGYMQELASNRTDWGAPALLGMPPEVDGLLAYWLGAWAIRLTPGWLPPDLAARMPFLGLLALTLAAVWYAIFHLARSPQAQPVAFAFGGEAHPTDYARALADGGLLAFVACLGLAQLAHETTPALAQLCCTALAFYGAAGLAHTPWRATAGATVGLTGLALSGAPSTACLLGLTGALLHARDASTHRIAWRHAGVLATITLAVALLSHALDLWRWRISLPANTVQEWRNLGRLLLWFTWPAWPLTLWTLWGWRRHLMHRGVQGLHLMLPLCLLVIGLAATFTTRSADRSLLLTLPALAALSAFALPILGRSLSALVDWFTLLFFSGCALVIWVVWISMQIGIPAQPAANVRRLAPGFEHSFSVTTFLIAIAATLAWAWLVKWRAGRHRAAIWKSLVLPAGGASLCWLLLMTLWLPLLDYARSYAPLVQQAVKATQPGGCVATHGMTRGQIAAFRFHGKLGVQAVNSTDCPWLIVDKDALPTLGQVTDLSAWAPVQTIRHPADRSEDILVYRRTP
jgi:hypothetical protein